MHEWENSYGPVDAVHFVVDWWSVSLWILASIKKVLLILCLSQNLSRHLELSGPFGLYIHEKVTVIRCSSVSLVLYIL